MSAAEKYNEQEDQDEEVIISESLFDDDGSTGGHDDGESIWLLSYADLMTLLMGFFALLTSMATFEPETFKEVGSQAAEYFGGETDKSFEELGKEIENVIKSRGLNQKVIVEKMRTQISITFEGTLFFDSGSVMLKDSAQGLMKEIIEILDQKASNRKFLVEGHTDDIPISKGLIASNWELSALRAGAVARLFEVQGFSREQIMTIGWGETRPLTLNRNESGQPISLNQAKNRRVVLKILNKHPL